MVKLKEETIIKKEIVLCTETILRAIAPYWKNNIEQLKNVNLADFYRINLEADFQNNTDLSLMIKMALANNLEIPTLYQSILLYPMTDFLETTKLTDEQIKDRQELFLVQLKKRVAEIKQAKSK